MWIVKMIGQPVITIAGNRILSRKFHYKKDALFFQKEVHLHGGKATVEPHKPNPQRDLRCNPIV